LDNLEQLREVSEHKGWQVYKWICEHYADLTNEQLLEVRPEAETNYLRGVVDTWNAAYQIVDFILEENKQYDERERKRRAEGNGRDAELARSWGSPYWHDQFRR
jgi:hypothetical protein